jgi:hypothetical protein
VYTRLILIAGFGLFCLFGAGCGKSLHRVEGTVTLDGAPVDGAMVTFNPTFEGGQSASGRTDSSGKFKLINPTSDKGIMKGQYKVTITKGDPVEDKLPTDAGDATKSMEEYWKTHKGTAAGGPKKAPASIVPKSILNVRYSKVDSTPFTITVPSDGAVTLQLEK